MTGDEMAAYRLQWAAEARAECLRRRQAVLGPIAVVAAFVLGIACGLLLALHGWL